MGGEAAVAAEETRRELVINASNCVMPSTQLRRYLDALFECLSQNFYGDVVVKIRAGRIVEMHKNKTIIFREEKA